MEPDHDNTAVLNSLIESQLKIASAECEDLRILESIIFPDHERAFCFLDKTTSTKVYRALEEVSDDRKIQCKHCNEVFTRPDFESHVCFYDEHQQPIPYAEVYDDKENELQEIHRGTITQLAKNRIAANSLTKASKNLDCFKCCRKFVHEAGLYRHYDKHIGELLKLSPLEDPAVKLLITVCDHCGEVFGRDCEAIRHAMTYHFKVMDSVSDSEGAPSVSKEVTPEVVKAVDQTERTLLNKTNGNILRKFLSTTHASVVFQCEFCESVFYDHKRMLLHVSKHFPREGFCCRKCELDTLTLKDLLLHRRDKCIALQDIRDPLREFPRLWVCNVCSDIFQSLEQLVIHRQERFHFFPRIEPINDRLVLSCPFCLEMFFITKDLLAHCDDKHSTKPKPEASLKTSERIPKEPTNRRGGSHQTSTRDRAYLCEICGKSYTQSSHLWQHLRFHQGVKPFACKVEGCNRKFTIRPDLNDHIRKCHTGERPFLCTICGKRFLTGSVFYQHRLIHRGERRYGCEECNKRFYRADALKNHMRIHTGEKPHACGTCGKTFRQRGDRDKHIKARHPGATIIPSPRKQRVKSFGRGRVKNNTSLYQSVPEAPRSP